MNEHLDRVVQAESKRVGAYVTLLQNHRVTADSPATLDLAWTMVERLTSGGNVSEAGYETLSVWAVIEGYDPVLMERAVKIAGGRL